MSRILDFLRQQSRIQVFLLSLLLVAFIGGIDALTGPELSLSAFYLIPIFLASSYVGLPSGLFVSVASVISYLLADRILSISYSRSAIPYWNAGVRLFFFITVAYILGKRKQAEERLQQSEERFRLLVEGVKDYALLMLDRYGSISSWNAGAQRLFGFTEEDVIGKHFSLFYEAEGSDDSKPERDLRFASEMDRFMDEGWRSRKDSLPFWADTIMTPLRDKEGKLRGFSLLVRDMTERKKSEAARRILAELHEIDRAILAADTPQSVTMEGLKGLLGMISYESGSVLILNPADDRADVVASRGDFFDARFIDAGELPEIEALKRGETHISSHRHGITSVPLLSQGQLIGILQLKTQSPLDAMQIDIAREVANQLAIAVHNTQLFEELKRAHQRLQIISQKMIEVQEAEKRHLARELHDEMGQALTAVKMRLEEIEAESAGSAIRPRLKDTVEIVQRVMDQVRSISLNLRPPILDDLGLIPALRWYASRQAQLAGFSVHFSEDLGDRHFSTELETTCFRVAQEALTNVTRHAQAQRVSVNLTCNNDRVSLLIKDDGLGFDVPATQERGLQGIGLGLLGMKERVSLIGGFIEVESAPLCGTEVRADFPISCRREAQA